MILFAQRDMKRRLLRAENDGHRSKGWAEGGRGRRRKQAANVAIKKKSAVVQFQTKKKKLAHVVDWDGLERQQLREEVGVGDRVREEQFCELAWR